MSEARNVEDNTNRVNIDDLREEGHDIEQDENTRQQSLGSAFRQFLNKGQRRPAPVTYSAGATGPRTA